MKVDAINGFPVHNINTGLNYATIQSAINAIQTVDGNSIGVNAGTYNETLTVSKGVSITGDNPSTTIINGQVTLSIGAEIANFTLNGGVKVFFSYKYQSGIKISNNLIIGNSSISNVHGVDIFSNEFEESDYGVIERNEIRDFSGDGISIARGNHWTISGNDIYNNGGGIEIYSSDSCTVTGNSIHNNTHKNDSYYYALRLEKSSNNVIYHNDLFGNPRQVYVSSYPNKWDNGREGNYWDDYRGTDSNGDGIGDTPYIIDSSNQDNFPLMHTYNIPEFQSFLILPLFMMATLLAVIIYRKKHADFRDSIECL
jgi:parallel beta-helix repeat protein